MLKTTCFLMTLAVAATATGVAATAADSSRPIVNENIVFAESDGTLAVEAEHFVKQSQTAKRAWHLTSSASVPQIAPDGDEPHLSGASGGAYLEILPDTRRTHDDKLIRGENFSPEPGQLAVLDYRVHISTPGRYYVWVRAFSTGSEDNGLHVGLNGEWPESGQRLQWCQGKRTWRWDSKQRTQEEHCGVPYQIYLDIKKAGEHTISFSMREDGFEFDKWLMTTNRELERPEAAGPAAQVLRGRPPEAFAAVSGSSATATAVASAFAQQADRQSDGNGEVTIAGELKQWHKVTVDLDGPFAHERDNNPNPFTDIRMTVQFRHESGSPDYTVPGYFAADGNAANSSAESGTKWRAHLSPDKPGTWSYKVSMVRGTNAALDSSVSGEALASFHGKSGSFEVAPTDKSGRDLRAKGRLTYVGKHYLQFAGNGEYFLKAGADAPETLLGYADFDATDARKDRVPLKTWSPHIRDWNAGDPVWKGSKGKGLIGAVNYLSGKGCNVFSFLTYNAGGDGDNVWPFVERDDKLHYDCSKLDQWGVVFDHSTNRGMYLHFKMQETEMDDNRTRNQSGKVTPALDGGDLGVERKLYCRELIARFAHELALNWNLGEENTQSTEQQQAMAGYIRDTDPYDHPIVVHTFPNEQDKVYRPLLGPSSVFTGNSLQNSNISDTHVQVVKWVRESAEAGKPWVVAFDESGSAAHGQPPDLGYEGFDGHDNEGKMIYTQHEIRHQTLWGVLMGGGGGVEYYFGYKFPQNDLVCEDWRSRDQSWDYCRIALEFFHDNKIPFWEMTNADSLVGNPKHDNSRYCFAKSGEVYLVYLPEGGACQLDLSTASGQFRVQWFDPRNGGDLQDSQTTKITAGGSVEIGPPPAEADEDWLAVIRRAR